MSAFAELFILEAPKARRTVKKFRWENEQGEIISRHVSKDDAVENKPNDGKYYQLIKGNGNGRGMEFNILEIGELTA